MPQIAITDDMKNLLSPEYVDLSSLPPPKIVEELSFGDIFDALVADFKNRNPAYDALLESDPVIIALEVAAYREVLLRHRINEVAKANMLAYAMGSDLDNLAAFYGISRLEEEQDDRLRYRAQLALEGLTTAGSEKAYLFHALSASPLVKSASVQSPEPGQVLITILSDEDITGAVAEYVGAEDKRPLTDSVVVQNAEIIEYQIHAKVHLYFSPSMPITQQECRDALDTYIAKQNTIGNIVARSGIYDALHTEGVRKVELLSPANDITATKQQAPECGNIELEFIIDPA
jgi:phage-related baseplate assembly protein